MTIKWGDPIECNGVRPDWLRDDEPAEIENSPREWLEWSGCVWHNFVTAIRLPADHPAYVALARGFTPWCGGESAPNDWDGDRAQNILLRNGSTRKSVSSWAWRENSSRAGHATDFDVIGYRKRNTRFDEPHLARVEVEGSAPVEGVFIKRMTNDEATEFANKAAFDGLGHTAPCYAASGAHACLKALGLIRPETTAERFTRETGHAVTEAVEAALNWKES